MDLDFISTATPANLVVVFDRRMIFTTSSSPATEIMGRPREAVSGRDEPSTKRPAVTKGASTLHPFHQRTSKVRSVSFPGLSPFRAAYTASRDVLDAIDRDNLASPHPGPSMAATMGEKSPVRPSRRRKSSSLGADPRGDTGANSMATSQWQQSSQTDLNRAQQRTSSTKERGRKRRKARNAWRRYKRFALKHTWVTPLLLMTILLSLYFISPGEHNPLHSAIFLSYANPPMNERTNTLPAHIGNVTQYGKGPKDFAFVGFYTIVLSFTREFLMQRLIAPIATHYGITRPGKRARFMEQYYTAIYFAVFGPLGVYVMSRTPVWYFNTRGMFEGFPHRAHEAWFKAWYLLEAAYWTQQAIVLMLQLEKPRKDFRELVLHHIITLALIGLSYRFHFTYMGVAVYITHDVSDFFLATSKVLNYIDSWYTPPYFIMFMGMWAYLRHFINLKIIYALFPYNLGLPGYNQFATVGNYQLNWETQQYKCWISQVITFCLLISLQAVNIFWFFLIIRILVRLVFKGVQKDVRSDDEDETDELEAEAEPETTPLMNGSSNHDVDKPSLHINGKPFAAQEVIASSATEGGVASGSEPSIRRSPRKRG